MGTTNRCRKERKGLSTVVGAVFMIIVMTSALNVTLWTMRQQDKVTESVIEKTNTSLNRLNEDLSISDIKISNGKMNMTVSNFGGAASYLRTLYVVNETSNQQYRYDINVAVDGRKSATNLGQSSPAITIKNNTNYSIKVVSQSGVSTTTSISPISSLALSMSLVAIPPTVVPGQNVTLLLAVTNNYTGSFIPSTVTPTLSKSINCSPPDCEFTDWVTPSSAYLTKGNTVFFKWVFTVDGVDGAVTTYNASLVNAKQGNYVIEKGLVQEVHSSEESEIFVGSTLLAKPEVFIFAPGPFGDAGNVNDRGYFGIVLANPINLKMNVSQITINLFSSNTDSSHKPLTSSGCGIVGISPPTTDWSCPHDGTLRWSNPINYVTINPYESYTFMAKVKPGTINSVEPALLISVTAFTNLGQFARQGYATNMFTTTAPIGQVYLTDTTTNTTAIQDSPTNHILGNIKMNSAQQRRINVTVADFETTNNAASRINAGTILIINVPKNFENIITPSSLPGFSKIEVLTTFADGTTQIRATLGEHVGDMNGAVEARVFYFDVTAPTVTISRSYVMHTFLDGFANTSPNFEVDAFGTFAILVCTSGC